MDDQLFELVTQTREVVRTPAGVLHPPALGVIEFYPSGLLHKFGFGDGDDANASFASFVTAERSRRRRRRR